MDYWLDLFTGTTWQEFQDAGAKVSGFREHNWKRASNIKSGDVFLCYMVGVKRWVGLLEVTGDRYRDDTTIWDEEAFPVRFPVKPLVMLPPEHGVPMETFKGKLSFFSEDDHSGRWSGWVRSSPTKYKQSDGEMIANAIHDASANPVSRPVEQRKLKRSANVYQVNTQTGDEQIETVVSVPDETDNDTDGPTVTSAEPTHSEIQWRLLDLGSQMGLHIWAPRSDRGREWQGKRLADVPRMLENLPAQFNAAANKTIENIDVLWLSGQSDHAIVAAFEVEHTTSIYSGLLRMSDLLTMQPNIAIKFYLVGPDDRLAKFTREVARPTFAMRKHPLHSLCSFLPYTALCERLDEAKNVIRHLRPEFLDEIAETYDPADEVNA